MNTEINLVRQISRYADVIQDGFNVRYEKYPNEEQRARQSSIQATKGTAGAMHQLTAQQCHSAVP
jgi:hypothetical protein